MNRTHTGRVRGRKAARGTPQAPHPYRKAPPPENYQEWQCALPARNPGPGSNPTCPFAGPTAADLRRHLAKKHGLSRAQWEALRMRLSLHYRTEEYSQRTDTILQGDKVVGHCLSRVAIPIEDRWYP